VKARRVMIKVCSQIGAFTPEEPKGCLSLA
jgi:hypothetical protein